MLAHPASIDNVPTDGGKEDHVSMGMTAATKLRSIVDNAELVTAIELITAAQGSNTARRSRPAAASNRRIRSFERTFLGSKPTVRCRMIFRRLRRRFAVESSMRSSSDTDPLGG